MSDEWRLGEEFASGWPLQHGDQFVGWIRGRQSDRDDLMAALEAVGREPADAGEAARLRAALENIHVNVKGLAEGMVPGIGADALWYFETIEAVCRAALAPPAGSPEPVAPGEGTTSRRPVLRRPVIFDRDDDRIITSGPVPEPVLLDPPTPVIVPDDDERA